MILGITGSIGCGKSTVLEMFGSASWHTADADGICRRMYENPDGEFLADCRREWGESFFTRGRFDRAKIAAVVFRDPRELKRLTALIYPPLTRRLREIAGDCRKAGKNAAIEVPLLYEAGMEDLFDRVLVIWAPAQLRHARLREFRGFDEAEIRRREAMQLEADAKLERGDYALINSGSTGELLRQFTIFLQQITQ